MHPLEMTEVVCPDGCVGVRDGVCPQVKPAGCPLRLAGMSAAEADVVEVRVVEMACDEIDPRSPTDAAPGSEAKILVMIARADASMNLFHPRDAQGNAAWHPERNEVAGVTWDAKKGCWRARVTVAGERVHLGLFDSQSTAERAAALAIAGQVEAAKALARRGKK